MMINCGVANVRSKMIGHLALADKARAVPADERSAQAAPNHIVVTFAPKLGVTLKFKCFAVTRHVGQYAAKAAVAILSKNSESYRTP